MALTRKFLKSLGVEEELIDAIIEGHTESTDSLKHEISELKEKAARVDDLEAELKTAKENAEKSEKDPYKVKYETIKEEFENYKSDVAAKETKSAKENAYRELLKASGISEKRFDSILKVTDLDKIKLDKDGKLENQEEATKSIKEEWSDFIVSESVKGASTAQPPVNIGSTGKKTREEIMSISNGAERRAAIAENLSLFSK